ncbi:MAG TPA: prepilin-type N-terminal cleavage/methylation domain-containing protein [Gemmatimonadaceae bacterium]|nr:prepilin-type N-terminal cleavage/methylation domain-containing protein [Gemmatimonadaceae bacterium]
MYPTRTRRSGFTLIELITVMAVMAAMMAIVAPKLRVTAKTKARIAARQLMIDLEQVRNRSLSQKKKVRIAFNTVANSYTAYADHNSDGVITESATERSALNAFGVRTLESGIVFGRGNATAGIPSEAGVGAVTYAGAAADFDTRGIPTPVGTTGTVYVTTTSDPSAVYAVSMTAAGSYRFWSFNPNGSWQ